MKINVKIIPLVTCNPCLIIVFPLNNYFDRIYLHFPKLTGKLVFQDYSVAGLLGSESDPNYLVFYADKSVKNVLSKFFF